MSKRTPLLLLVMILAAGMVTTCKQQKNMITFGIDYKKVTLSEIRKYDMVVVEQDHYSDYELKELSQSRTRILGYLSMSEVHPARSFFYELKQTGLIGKNENWNSYYINLQDSTVRSVMLDKVVPDIMEHGLDGLLLDTIDGVAPYTARSHMQDEMVSMIRHIRERYPDAYLLQNGGLFLLDRTKQYISGVLLESVATRYDFENKHYQLRSDSAFRARLRQVDTASQKVDDHFFIVDYVDTDSMAGQVRARLDTLPYSYYLSRIQLDSLRHYSLKTLE
ncbi:MAG: endo alpha-1,4 polygalactosaminidase [Balneolaceae bacterium]|nr:endo alpha-1,4 polygalactosaminidase [Balneolaceae bacterium]